MKEYHGSAEKGVRMRIGRARRSETQRYSILYYYCTTPIYVNWYISYTPHIQSLWIGHSGLMFPIFLKFSYYLWEEVDNRFVSSYTDDFLEMIFYGRNAISCYSIQVLTNILCSTGFPISQKCSYNLLVIKKKLYALNHVSMLKNTSIKFIGPYSPKFTDTACHNITFGRYYY